VCVVLVLALRPREEHEAKLLTLKGRTSKGQPVVLGFVDGELRNISATTLLYCPGDPSRYSYDWLAVAGSFGTFHREGSTFRIRDRREYGARGEPAFQVTEGAMHGRLADSGDSARGTIDVRWEWGKKQVCKGTVRFSARRRP